MTLFVGCILMAATRIIPIQPPTGGVVRSFAYQKQSPYTCYDALNVWPQGQHETRRRLGSRPGLQKAYATELGDGSPVRMLSSVVRATAESQFTWRDGFDDTDLSSVWSVPSDLAGPPDTPGIGQIQATPTETIAGYALGDARGMVHEWVGGTDFDNSASYTLSMNVQQSISVGGVQTWHFNVYAMMDDTTPLPATNSVLCQGFAQKDGALYTLDFYVWGVSGGVKSIIGGGGVYGRQAAREVGTMEVVVSGTTVTMKWNGVAYTGALDVSGYVAGSRFGFGLNPYTTDSTYAQWSEEVGITYRPFASPINPDTLIAGASTTVYHDDLAGGFIAATATSSHVISPNTEIMAEELGGVLYVADYERITEGVDGSINATDELTATAIADWTKYVTTTTDQSVYVQIFDAAGDAVNGVYTISSISGATLTLSGGGGTGSNATSYRLFYRPKKVQYTDDSGYAWRLDEWTASNGGTIPYGCPLIARYNGRIVLAGQPWAPHVWYQSKQNDALDFDYTDTTDQGAVAGTSTETGVIADPLTALAAYQDDYLLYFADDKTYIQRGDLRTGGTIDVVSQTVGCVGKSAWCHTPDGTLYWLSLDGLYGLPPGALGIPQPISRQKLPEELLDIDVNETVLLEYDHYNRGIWIFVVHPDNRKTHWWHDLTDGGFWPVRLPKDLEPTSLYRQGTNVYFGCRDGYVRELKQSSADDDGELLDSSIIIGPIRPGGNDYVEGMVHRVDATLSSDSDDVNWIMTAEETSEEAVKNMDGFPLVTQAGVTLTTQAGDDLETQSKPRANGTWSSGKNYAKRTRVREAAVSFRLGSGDPANRGWALESITLQARPITVKRKH